MKNLELLISAIEIQLQTSMEKYNSSPLSKEIKRLYDKEFVYEDDQYTVFFELQMLSELVEGVAYSLVKKGKISDVKKAQKELGENNTFQNENFLGWLVKESKDYPRLMEHFHLLNSIRCQLIETLKVMELRDFT